MLLSEKQLNQYLHRSYGAVDGLWFMKVEEKYGFERALEIDRAVWEILPKIQARQLKSMLGLDDSAESLQASLMQRLEIDDFDFSIEETPSGKGFCLIVNKCPWYKLMLKSGRQQLAGRVGDVVCRADYSAWAAEFKNGLEFHLDRQICQGHTCCRLEFRGQ